MKPKNEATNTKKPTARRRPAAEASASAKPARAPRKRPIAAKPKQEPAIDRVQADQRVSAEAVRQRAYFLYLERKGVGDPVADWLIAERELTAGRD